MTVAPDDLVAVVPDRFQAHWLERAQFTGLEYAKRIRRLLALLPATRARAVRPQVLPGVDAVVAVAPVDGQALVALFAQTSCR